MLAGGNILGGNCFDVLLLTFSDAAFPEGSIYRRIGSADVAPIGLSMGPAGILLMELMRRERKSAGFEGWLILGAYGADSVLPAIG